MDSSTSSLLRHSGFLEITGGSIEYNEVQYDPDALTIVMLHEGLGCVAMWKDFPMRIAYETGMNVFIYSRFGYGRSDAAELPRPLSYMGDEALIHLPEILRQKVAGEFVLLGHSDGASIASIYAGAQNDPALKGLVVMAPHYFTEQVSIDSITKARRAYLDTDMRKKLAFYHGQNVDNAFDGWNDAWLHPDFRDWNIESYLEDIKVPAFAIQGADDEYGSMAHIESLKKRSGAQVEELVLPECGHSPFKDLPEETLDAVAGFLKKL